MSASIRLEYEANDLSAASDAAAHRLRAQTSLDAQRSERAR